VSVALRAVAVVLLVLVADDLGDLRKRSRQAFRPYDVDAPARAAKRLDDKLPGGIVTESGPFDAVIEAELKPLRATGEEREAVLRALAGKDAAGIVIDALESVAKEWTRRPGIAGTWRRARASGRRASARRC